MGAKGTSSVRSFPFSTVLDGGGGGGGTFPVVCTAGGYLMSKETTTPGIVQELCESRGGRPGLSVLMSLLVSVDVKIY